MQKGNTAGCIGPASVPLKDAAPDAVKEEAGQFVCRICGKPSERKRRRDGSLFYYDRCRRCRRATASGNPAPARISEGRLLYLLEILEEHLLKLKEAGWQNAPKKVVVKRLRTLVDRVKE